MAEPVPPVQDGGYGSAKAGPTQQVIRTTVRTARNAAPQSGIPLTNLCCMNLLFIIGVHTFILPSAMLCPSALEDISFPWTWSMPLPHEQAPPAFPSSSPRGIPPKSPLAGPTPPQDERYSVSRHCQSSFPPHTRDDVWPCSPSSALLRLRNTVLAQKNNRPAHGG